MVKTVHPLCSRKRALSKIISSPTYQKRSKKENNRPLHQTKKEESRGPKFEFLKRKKRYGDDLLKNKNKGVLKKKALQESQDSCKQASKQQNNADGVKTPLRIGKEYAHPLCSRVRPLSKIVASPSYPIPRKLLRASTSSLYNIPQRPLSSLPQSLSKCPTKTPPPKRRYTMMPSLQNLENKENLCNITEITSPTFTSTIRKSCMKGRRHTTFASSIIEEDVSFCVEGKGAPTDIRNSTEKESCLLTESVTPWKNKEMSMRERLDLWLADKNKAQTPQQPKYKKSPYPKRKFKSVGNLDKLTKEKPNASIERYDQISSEENSAVISKELENIVRKFEDKVEREEIERELDHLICKYTTIVKFADYWICKARLASLDDDVQRVICLLEQAHTFQAQPGEKIKEEICRYLECLEECEQNDDIDSDQEKQIEEDKGRLLSLYAITPGRRVHFAAPESPVDFKSSVIRFCLLESKAFKRRLKEQLNRKVLTPVRRSMRVERSDLPDFLRTDNRVVTSPGEVEGDIIDGEISFVPNKSLNTPLNNGWLIQDEKNADLAQDELKSLSNEGTEVIPVVENDTNPNVENETTINYSCNGSYIDRGINNFTPCGVLPNVLDVGLFHKPQDDATANHDQETIDIQDHEETVINYEELEEIELSFM